MSGSKLCRVLLILCVCLNVSFAWAAEKKAGNTTVYSLGEVTISADMPGDEAIPTLEITDTQINRRHANTLDKALELLPGIDVSKGAKGIPRINIRGFRSRHTILLLNGIPLNSTYDGQFDPHLIATENIAKIKVSYGNHSVLYGQGGLAGVINIITKQGTKGLSLDALAEIDERGNHYSKANVSGGKDNVNFFASLSNSDAKGFLLSDDFKSTSFEDGGVRENSDDEKSSFFGNIGFQLGDDLEMGLTLERSTGEFGTPPTTVDDKTDLFYKSPKYDRTEDFETLSGQVSLGYTPNDLFGFKAWAFANNNEEDLARYDDATYTTMVKKNSYTSTNKSSIRGATLQGSFDFKSSGMAVISFSGEKDDYTSNGQKVLKKGDPATAFNLDNELNIYSAALEYKIDFFSRLDLIMGYSHHWQTKDIGSDEDMGSYMIGTSFKLSDMTTLRASFARKIRFASIKQLYDATSGVSSLKPEQSKNYEAGINQKLPWKMALDLTVFQNNVEDYIEKNDTTELYENNDEYEFRGVEVSLTKQILENGSIGFGYSYLDTKDKSSGTLKDELQYRPKNKFTVKADYTWDFGLTASADFMHVADQYYYSDSFDKGKLDDYSIVNLKLEQNLYKHNYFIFVGVDNLLDEHYEESYGYTQAGRTLFTGIRINF